MRRSIYTIIFLSIILNAMDSFAYEKKVHREITKNAINVSNTKTYFLHNYNMQLDLLQFNDELAFDWIEDGSAFEDGEYEGGPKWLENLISATVEKARYKNHFYDPTTGKGLNDTVQGYTLTGLPSLEWAKDYSGNDYSWKKARLYFLNALTDSESEKREEYFALLFRSLGQVMHLLQDKSVPAHVRNDSHGLELNGYDMYEKYTESNTLTYTGYPVVSNEAFNILDRFWDTDSGLGLAEFTNSNFLSRDSNIDDKKYSLPVSTGYSITTEHVYDPYYNWWTDAKVKYLHGYATDKYRPETSKPIAKLSAVSFFDYEVNRYFGKNLFSLNKFTHKEYANLLIPRAVGYSAGLLNYFFRGTVFMEEDTQNAGKYIIKNESSEKMEGTFALYYDDASGNRNAVPGASWTLTINPNSTSSPVTFTEPTSPAPKEKGKYILVFKGKLGMEEGAVVGREVKIEEEGKDLILFAKDGQYKTFNPANGNVKEYNGIFKGANGPIIWREDGKAAFATFSAMWYLVDIEKGKKLGIMSSTIPASGGWKGNRAVMMGLDRYTYNKVLYWEGNADGGTWDKYDFPEDINPIGRLAISGDGRQITYNGQKEEYSGTIYYLITFDTENKTFETKLVGSKTHTVGEYVNFCCDYSAAPSTDVRNNYPVLINYLGKDLKIIYNNFQASSDFTASDWNSRSQCYRFQTSYSSNLYSYDILGTTSGTGSGETGYCDSSKYVDRWDNNSSNYIPLEYQVLDGGNPVIAYVRSETTSHFDFYSTPQQTSSTKISACIYFGDRICSDNTINITYWAWLSTGASISLNPLKKKAVGYIGAGGYYDKEYRQDRMLFYTDGSFHNLSDNAILKQAAIVGFVKE